MAYSIEFTKAAHIALSSLRPEYRFELDQLIPLIKEDISNSYLKTKLRKLANSPDELFSLKIGEKYRGILKIDIESHMITILDIVNHESLKKFFKLPQDA